MNFWTSENRNVTILILTILNIVILNQSYQSYPKSFPCIMEMCITGYGVMDNSVHSIWKSKVQLSRVCQVKCVSFFIFYQRLYTAADFCVKYHFKSIPETVVKRTVE